ncbi:hypothetical protein VTG60DRAFT_5127 [Thermothelomyces hinnuleus]
MPSSSDMAASRRGQPPLAVRLPSPSAAVADLPPISALFLIDFDVKAGYTIIWKRAVQGLELEGAVEYKSLPSGLHTVTDDLIYFVHDGSHAGLSAFVNTPTDEEESRHARMISVGVLVPLSHGRLGRAWRHAEGLKDLAAKLAADREQTQLLEEYWSRNAASETTALQPLKDIPLESPLLGIKTARPCLGKGHARNRSASDGTALIPPGHGLSPFHPAWSLTSLLDTFGPLVFPIHRAALLRKRILISCHAPVHEVCNFVYDISVLSNIPLSVCDVIDPAAPVQRLRPLFCVGVHDISYLLEYQAATKRGGPTVDPDDYPSNSEDASSGWVACTTDSILAMKEGLWDMLITMPPPYSSNAKQRVWPTVECPKGVPVKATQRDLRRFRSLCLGLARLATRPPSPSPRSSHSEASDSPTPALRLSKTAGSRSGTAAEDTDAIIEPVTWAALAYNGFMWWASAGEKRHSDELDEQTHDASLLADLVPLVSPAVQQQQQQPRERRPSLTAAAAPSGSGMIPSLASLTGRPSDEAEEEQDGDDGSEAQARIELAVVAYFHRLTTTIFSVLADIVDSTDDDDLLDLDLNDGHEAYTSEYDSPVGAAASSSGAVDRGSSSRRKTGRRRTEEEEEEEEARLLGATATAAASAAGSGDERNRMGWVRVDSDALAEMGLDVWSQADADFVREVSVRYFNRRAHVETKGVEVCGLRVC